MAARKSCPWSTASTLVSTRRASVTSERFSLLLLEFGEIYFEDFSADYHLSNGSEEESLERKQRGRLKLCSESILFDPLDISYPIIKILFKDCQKIQKYTNRRKTLDNSFIVVASQVIEMLERNIMAPYQFIKKQRQLLFSLNYGSIDAVLSKIVTLERAVKLGKKDQNTLIESIVHTRQTEVSFNTSWLENFYEEIVLETHGERVTPLVSNPGRIMLTSSRIYFQPFNNVEVEPVIKLELSSLTHAMKRRYMLRHVGLELFTRGGQSIFLVLSSPSKRNTLYDKLINIHEVQLESVDLVDMTQKWQTGEVSNYEYLMYLNFSADRSFNDIMQYPVMPWILADYTSSTLDLARDETFRNLSKPIGALNDERLSFFKERYTDMAGRKFLYGTHYSAPGYVLYYLVRTSPEYLLCLQNGKFDHPNRLFHSVAKTWENVLTDHADVKELIPEFYQPPGDYLLNFQSLNLGVRSDAVRVNDVILPPWAKNAKDFTTKCLEALECDYVSERIHNWIDLIFGYKQQGSEAIKADNLFHYLTYESSSAIDQLTDPAMKAAIELQIKEFGQTPKQLFRSPHPKRRVTINRKPTSITSKPTTTNQSIPLTDPGTPSDDNGASDWVFIQTNDAALLESDGKCTASVCKGLKMKTMERSHREPISCVKLSHDSKTVFSVSHDKTLKVHQVNDWQLLRSSSISSLPLSSIAILPDSKTVAVGSWDNYMYLYSVEFASVINSCYIHDSSVTCVCWKEHKLATGSWDSTVKIWDFPYNPSCSKPPPPELVAELDHDTEVTALDMNSTVTLVASGVADGFLTVWSIQHEAKEFELKAHSSEILAVVFSPDGSTLCTTGSDGFIKLFSISERSESIAVKREEPYCCAVWQSDRIVCGGQSGTLSLLDSSSLNIITSIKNHTDTITSLDVSLSNNLVVTGGKDKSLGVWSLV